MRKIIFFRKIIFTVVLIITSVLMAQAQNYKLGNTAYVADWFKLGTLIMPQGGADAELRIVAGGGYNANQEQQGECTIHFRTSNAVDHNIGFYGSGSFYNTGGTGIVAQVRVVQINTSTWDFYALLPPFTGEGAVLNVTASLGQWNPGFVQKYLPENSVFADLRNELIFRSNTYFAGDVGIGTAYPKEKLSVNGRIRATEVKVETANWPDYVFADDYKQLPITEIESYIKEHKHLPKIPSAAEVQKNDLSLGEMNGRLLEKIEELTLLLIEQDKRIRKLESSNSHLEGE